MFPVAKKNLQGVQAMGAGVAQQEFRGCGRRAGAGVEQDDADFAFRERLIDDRQVADDQREKTETEAAFEDGEDALDGGVRGDVAEAESEEGGAAEIEAGLQRGRVGS